MGTTATLKPPKAVVGVEPSARNRSVRRYIIAVVIGGIVVAVPYHRILTDLWNRSPDPFRTVLPKHTLSNFYDLQARAILQGHLYVPNGSLGEEAFLHAGRQYTYFGLFPSLLRMPVLLFTHSFDGRLTAPSILLSWVVTGVFSALLLWRVRLLVRGPVVLGRAEATTYGVLVATILGGSVLVDLAASPWVYSEDITWSVALTIGSLFALLGILEAPSRWRVVVAGVLILAAALTRGSTGYGCILGALLAAAWFASGHGGKENRRWWWPVLLTGALPLLVASAISWAKFGVVYGYPLHDQVFFNRFLRHIKGSYFSGRYVPTTVATYLGFNGLNFSRVFPFITLPLQPARAVGNVPLFMTQQMTSVPESMPLLFLLTIWGLVTAFRRRVALRTRTTVIPLIAAAAPCGAILIFGFLDNRFLGDFVPLLVVGSAVGIASLWRRLDGRGRVARDVVVGVAFVLGVFGIAANVALASTPTGWWSSWQVLHFVEFQNSVGDVTGHPLAGYVKRGMRLPRSAPVGQLFITGDCTGLYVFEPNGLRHWLAVEKAPSTPHGLDITIHRSTAGLGQGIPLFTVGNRPTDVVSMDPDGQDRVRFVLKKKDAVITSTPVGMEPNRTYRMIIAAHGATDRFSATSHHGTIVLEDAVFADRQLVVDTQYGRSAPTSSGVTVVGVGHRASAGPLCRSLESGSVSAAAR